MRNDKGVSEQSSYYRKMMELNFSNKRTQGSIAKRPDFTCVRFHCKLYKCMKTGHMVLES